MNKYYNMNPLKINLYLENEQPIELTGGAQDQTTNFVQMNLINNNVYKYLKSDPKSKDSVWFKFNPKRNTNTDSGTSYMDRSPFNVNFVINYLYKISNTLIEIPKDNIVLKLINLTTKTIDEFIEGWIQDVKTFAYAIPEIFLYGQVFTKDGTFISNYIITKKYDTYESLLKLNYNQAVKYIIKMLFFLNKLVENDIILRNFKFSNIGYDFINSQIEFILLDYTDSTLIRKSNKFFSQFVDGCDAMCAGTLIPYFIIKDFFDLEKDWTVKLNKLYIIGLAETIIFIMYKQDKVMEEFFSLLYFPSEQKPCIHYYKYLTLFNDEEKRIAFNKLLSKLQPKYIEMDKFKINPFYIRIIQNCFEKNYNQIEPPSTYISSMQEIYGKLNDMKNANASGLVVPINNENQYVIVDKNENIPELEGKKNNILTQMEKMNFNPQSDKPDINAVSNEKFINNLLSTNIKGGSLNKSKLKRYKLQNSIIL